MEKITRKMRSTAYHEAGHAVVNFHFGSKIREISIIAEDDSLGYCRARHPLQGRHPDFDKSDANRLRMEKSVISDLAGFFAEQRFNPKGTRTAGARGDFQRAVDVVDYFVSSTEELQAYIDFLGIRAKNIVNSRLVWPLIPKLAERLLVQKRMKGKEVRGFLIAEQGKMFSGTHGG
jgi:hypothetical protein